MGWLHLDTLAGVPVTAWLWALAGVALGLVVGWLADRRLRGRHYRYDDEVDLPERSTRWLWVALPLLCGLAFAGAATGSWLRALLVAAFCCGLAILSAIDLDVRRLPDRITLPLIPVTAAGAVALALVEGTPEAIVRALVAGLALGAFYLLQVIAAWGRGMGLGDAKLAVSLGLALGVLSWTHVVVGTFAAYLSGVVVGVLAAIRAGTGRRTEIAFGPHMAFGAALVLVLPGAVALISGP